MDLPVRNKLPHTIPQWVAEGSWYFITINCKPSGKNQLCVPDVAKAVLAAAVHNHEKSVWNCRLCLLMPDHLHAVIAFTREPGMKTTVANWKKFLSVNYKIQWQGDFFDHRLRDEQQLQEKTSYILLNPVRKGLCQQPEDWPWIYRPDYLPPPK